jgi:hypothetical protein
MTTVNPHTDDPDQAATWERGYVAGFENPDDNTAPPLSPDDVAIYEEGFTAGRSDRSAPPSIPPADQVSRFETAPDGTLIPIPSAAPVGHPIRDDAQITVAARTDVGYYVAINNFAADSDAWNTAKDFIVEVLTEASLEKLKSLLVEAAVGIAPTVIEYGTIILGVAISLLQSKPTQQEYFCKSQLDDGTGVTYIVVYPTD